MHLSRFSTGYDSTCNIRCPCRIIPFRSTGNPTGISRHFCNSTGEWNDVLSVFSGDEVLSELSAFRTGTGNTGFAVAQFNRMRYFIRIMNSAGSFRRNSCTSDESSTKCRHFSIPFDGGFRDSGRSIVCEIRLNTRNTIFLYAISIRDLIDRNTGSSSRHSIFISKMDPFFCATMNFSSSTRHFGYRRNMSRLICKILVSEISRFRSISHCVSVLRSTFCTGHIVLYTSTFCRVCIHTAKRGSIIESTSAFTACHLIPLTAIRCSDYTMGCIRLFKLRSTVHIHVSLLAVRSCRCGADMATGDLGPLHLEALHMRHVIAQRPICDVAGNRTGGTRSTGSNRRDRLAIQCCTISGCDSTECTAYETCTTTETHAGTTFNDSITDIGIGAESGSKSSSKPIRCCACTCCSSTTCTAKYTASRSCTTANSRNDTGRHKQLHTHTGTGLSNIQTHGRQIAVETLSTFQICQRTEHP